MKDRRAEDKAIEKLVATKLGAEARTPSTLCPDAAILAAYFERTLAPKERAAWEVHFDSCKKCQARIAALARMSEADEAGPVLAPAPARKATGKIFGLRRAWAAPLLLVVLVAGLWYTGELRPLLHQQEVRHSPRVSSPAPPTTAQVPAAVGASRGEVPSSTARKKQEVIAPSAPAPADKLKAAATSAERRAANAVRAETPGRKASRSESVGRIGATESDMVRRAVPLSAAEEETAGPQPLTAQEMAPLSSRSAPPPEATPKGSGTGGAAKQNVSAAVPKRMASAGEESLPVEGASPHADQSGQTKILGTMSARKVVSQPEKLGAVQLEKAGSQEAGFHYRRSPSRSTPQGFTSTGNLWRVGPHGLIQKQAADGHWETKPSGVTANLTDITFAGTEIGWAVGQGGVVLRTTNGGESWSRIKSPTSSDLGRVTATSGASALITTTDGKIFSTDDGGATWIAVSDNP